MMEREPSNPGGRWGIVVTRSALGRTLLNCVLLNILACSPPSLSEEVNESERSSVSESCQPGTSPFDSEGVLVCAACGAGKYCAGGTARPQSCEAPATDHDNDPATPCTADGCLAGTQRAVDGSCAECEAGTYCSGGDAAPIPCDADTWDHDGDPATVCEPHSRCAPAEFVESEGSAVADRSCAPCPDDDTAEGIHSSTCGAWGLDGWADAPVYRVELYGALIAPFDDRGEVWDETGLADAAHLAALEEVRDSYEASLEWLIETDGLYPRPEVYGRAQLSVRGFPEVTVTLIDEATPQETALPEFASVGFSHVPLHKSTRILISLFDDDFETDDLISYLMLDAEDLQAAADAGDVTAIPVADLTGNRTLWLELLVQQEQDGANKLAPSELDDVAPLAEDTYERPTQGLHTLWVHGLDFYGGANVARPWGNEQYWEANGGPGIGGPEPFAVNYHARAYLAVSNVAVEYAMDRFCVAPASCILACHSAGCAQVGYALARRGQLGERWQVARVVGGGAASGGSELADGVSWSGIAGFLGDDLRVERMRDPAFYDHDALGIPVDYCAGASDDLGSGILPGQDDGAVAYHSAGGTREALAYGNPLDVPASAELPWLKMGPLFYAGHQVFFRDDTEEINHGGTRGKIAEWIADTYP